MVTTLGQLRLVGFVKRLSLRFEVSNASQILFPMQARGNVLPTFFNRFHAFLPMFLISWNNNFKQRATLNLFDILLGSVYASSFLVVKYLCKRFFIFSSALTNEHLFCGVGSFIQEQTVWKSFECGCFSNNLNSDMDKYRRKM